MTATTKKIKSQVNVRKNTIRVVVDENNPASHLVSFTFDALVDGRCVLGSFFLFQVCFFMMCLVVFVLRENLVMCIEFGFNVSLNCKEF